MNLSNWHLHGLFYRLNFIYITIENVCFCYILNIQVQTRWKSLGHGPKCWFFGSFLLQKQACTKITFTFIFGHPDCTTYKQGLLRFWFQGILWYLCSNNIVLCFNLIFHWKICGNLHCPNFDQNHIYRLCVEWV